MTDDAVLTMPPIDVRIEGAEAVGEFFATEPLGGHLERIALVPTRASGQPGFACYADEHGTGEHTAYGVMIFALRGDKIAGDHRLPTGHGAVRAVRGRSSSQQVPATDPCDDELSAGSRHTTLAAHEQDRTDVTGASPARKSGLGRSVWSYPRE